MKLKHVFLAICTALTLSAAAAPPACFQKGVFQGEGVLSDPSKEDREVIFKFTGSVSLRYGTTPAIKESFKWDTIQFHDIGVRVRISEVATADGPYDPHRFDVERGYDAIYALAHYGQRVSMSIDNPTLSFSNSGDLVEISGTYVALCPLEK